MKNVSEEIIQLFKKHGHILYGEDCSVLSHSFQGGMIAHNMGLDEDLVLAAFLHDIGHLYPLELANKLKKMGDFGIQSHDIWGAEYLKAKGFSERVIASVQNHVNAKRYLCLVEEDYYQKLSEASRETLRFQGGIMSADEADQFQRSLYFRDAILIRRIDEEAKGIDFEILPEHWELLKDLIHKKISSPERIS